MAALHWVSVLVVVFEGNWLLSRGGHRGRGVAPRCVDGAAGPRVPHRAVVQVGVSAVAQHGAHAGESAGGAALRGGGVLPAETEDVRTRPLCHMTPPQWCRGTERLPDLVGHLLLVAALVAAADEEPDEEQQEEQQEQRTDHRPGNDARLVGGWRRRQEMDLTTVRKRQPHVLSETPVSTATDASMLR